MGTCKSTLITEKLFSDSKQHPELKCYKKLYGLIATNCRTLIGTRCHQKGNLQRAQGARCAYKGYYVYTVYTATFMSTFVQSHAVFAKTGLGDPLAAEFGLYHIT